MNDRLKKILPTQHGASAEIFFLRGGKRDLNASKEFSERVKIILRIPRSIGAFSPYLIIKDADLKPVGEYSLKKTKNGYLYDEYKLSRRALNLSRGLYFLDFKLISPLMCFSIRRVGTEYKILSDPLIGELPQLTVVSYEYGRCESILGGIIYHVFVDRYSRDEGAYKLREGARLVEGKWDKIPEYPEYPGAPMKNNSFFGGTLDGIRENLDKISSIGANIIYLSPIFDSPTNHKYDTSDYMRVDESFGGDEALKRLIAAAKKRNIRIVLDGVFNHTGSDSVYFNKFGRYATLGAYNSKESVYYPWYDFRSYPDDYVCWWGIEILPRLNTRLKSVKEYFAGDEGVIEKYRKMGIYGLRLDVCDELPDDFVRQIKKRLSKSGESYLIGEVWEDGSDKVAYGERKSYYLGDELDGVMNYPLREGIVEFLTEGRTDKLLYALKVVLENCPPRIRNTMMNILGSHDTERIITVLSGESGRNLSPSEKAEYKLSDEKKKIAEERLMLAYLILATLPGIPSVYYGDEAGLEGFSDPYNRMPYPFNEENKKILDFYKKIGIIRRVNSIYGEGEFSLLHLERDLLLFSRASGRDAYVTLINNSDEELFVRSDKRIESLLFEVRGARHTIPPMNGDILKTTRGNTFSFYRG